MLGCGRAPNQPHAHAGTGEGAPADLARSVLLAGGAELVEASEAAEVVLARGASMATAPGVRVRPADELLDAITPPPSSLAQQQAVVT